MRFLKLQLCAPLQSWGERAKWDSRDTAKLPTKSGVIGLLGCCLGLTRESQELAALCEKLHMAVRVDNAGFVMTDFQTVQAPNEKGFPAAGGGYRGSTIITPRQYLQDASFAVFLWGDDNCLNQCAEALHHPVWTPYLGRKNCIPSVPLVYTIEEAECIDDVIVTDATCENGKVAVEIEMMPGDDLKDDERVSIRNDMIINAAKNEYAARKVRSSYRKVKET